MARELILILADFFARAQVLPHQGVPAERALPRLDALETLLSRSRRDELPQGWRAWLAAHCGVPHVAALTPATAAARAWLAPGAPEAPETQYWLATPLHCLAGIDSVHLHPDGLLQLDAEEQATLVADFAVVFADTSWRLHAIGGRELLLAGEPLPVSGADPARFIGRDPSPGLPQGASAARLRRLGAEIEMWLHGHRINRERIARGALPLTMLWFWGSLPQAACMNTSASNRTRAGSASRGTPARLYGRDVYAEALWRLRGAAPEALPEGFERLPRGPDATEVAIWPTLGADGLATALQRLEAHWLAPALRALRARRLAALRLLTGDTGYCLRWPDLARFWRRRAPWWEELR